jgi:DNA replication protein DnaC
MSENVTKTKEQDGRKPPEDYRDADGILVCGKCGEPRERMFPAGGIFKEPHLVQGKEDLPNRGRRIR